jgi:hypothetical protein
LTTPEPGGRDRKGEKRGRTGQVFVAEAGNFKAPSGRTPPCGDSF